MSLSDHSLFFGKPFEYWVELNERAENLNVEHLLSDLAKYHAKVSFLTEKLQEMQAYLDHVNKMR